MIPTTPTARREHKAQLIKRIIQLELMISANLDNPVELGMLRKEYREIHDQLELYYDDDPAERPGAACAG